MANRIQFRRDTSANWTRVNPVLEDGEPGLEIDTNYIKYGDGNTAWVDLDYASTGGSTGLGNALVNGNATVSLGADGVLTLPNGSTILESTYLGADSIILKPHSGTSTQYLEIAPTAIDGNHVHLMAGSGTELFLGDDNQYVKLADTGDVVINSNDNNGNTAQWTFNTAGVLTVPGEGVIQSINDTVTLRSINSISGNANVVYVGTSGGLGFSDQANPGNWLEIFRHNTDPQIGTPGNLRILTDSTDTAQLWEFGTDGTLSTPGNVTIGTGYGNISMVHTISANNYVYANGVSILANITGGASTGNITFNGPLISLDAGTTSAADTWIDISPSDEGYAFLQLPNDVTANVRNTRLWNSAGNVEIVSGDESNAGATYTWKFNKDGNLTLPSGGTIGAIETTDSVDLYGDANVQYVQLNWNNQNFVYADSAGAHLQAGNSSPGEYQISLGTDGTTTFPDHKAVTMTGNLTVGNLTVNGNIAYINTNSYVVSDNIVQFADGNPADTLDLGFVAHRTVSGNIQHTGLVRDSSAGNWKLFSNVTAQPGSTVDFANVIYDNLQLGTVYSSLVSTTNLHIEGTAPSTNLGSAGDLEGDIRVDDNYVYYCTADWVASSWTVGWEGATSNTLFLTKGAYPTPQVGWIVDFDDYGPWTIDTVTDNGTNWQITWVGATFGSPSGGTASLTNPNPSVIWKSIPLTAFQTSTYGNTNVASYLPTYSGNVSAANFIGGGSAITSLSGAAVSGNVAEALVAYSVNISPVILNQEYHMAILPAKEGQYGVKAADGTANVTYNPVQNRLTIANIAATNITAGNVSTSGNITAAYFVTSGGFGNISQVDTITANTGVYSGNITASGIAGFYAPNRPGFRVTGPGGQLASVVQVTGANLVVDFNQGSHLNTTTGYFTAPVAGLYQVNLVVRTHTNTGVSAQAVVEKNNSTVIIMVEWAANTTMNHTGGSTVTKLAVGDTLRFRVLLGSISFDGNDNWSVAYLG